MLFESITIALAALKHEDGRPICRESRTRVTTPRSRVRFPTDPGGDDDSISSRPFSPRSCPRPIPMISADLRAFWNNEEEKGSRLIKLFVRDFFFANDKSRCASSFYYLPSGRARAESSQVIGNHCITLSRRLNI